MKLSDYTLSLIDDIEKRIDPDTEDDYLAQWQGFWAGKTDAPVFTPVRTRVSDPGIKLKNIHINDALENVELMLARELEDVSRKLSKPSPALGIRANYGTGIITSLFGAELFVMPREMKTLPTTRPIANEDKIREIAERGVPDLNTGFGKSVFEFADLARSVFEKYPKISKYVYVYHPDMQGPLDAADLLWGTDIFYAMYDDPDLMHSLLRTVTDTYTAFMDKWYSYVPKRDGLSLHWSILHKGNLMIRLDSAMNLSLDFYEQYSKPYDKELFDRFGGGCLHFCGRGDHFIGSAMDIENMYGFNMSQPHLNDMDKILTAASAADKRIISLKDAEKYAAYPSAKRGIITAAI